MKLPKSGETVVGFYEDGECSWFQLCYYKEDEGCWYGVGGMLPNEQTGCPDYWIQKPGIDVFEDDIIIYDNDKNRQVIESAGCKFDDNGECQLTMVFSDGYARALDGKFEMTYPTIEQVSKSAKMQSEITAYTGRSDINQFDIALKYGEIRKAA